MKKILVILATCAIFILSACGGSAPATTTAPPETMKETTASEETATEEVLMLPYELGFCFFEVPSTWEAEVESSESMYFYRDDAAILVVCASTQEDFSMKFHRDDFIDKGGFSHTGEKEITVNGEKLYYYGGTIAVEEENCDAIQVIGSNNSGYIQFAYAIPESSVNNYNADFEKVFKSIELKEIEETTEATTAFKETATDVVQSTEAEKDSTLGERNALQKAKDYLAFMPFSYTGLIDQLEYEGYTIDEATYGADNCGADWMEQAALKAQDYIDYTAFSRQGLIDQLLYEGFTEEEALYGVESVGF